MVSVGDLSRVFVLAWQAFPVAMATGPVDPLIRFGSCQWDRSTSGRRQWQRIHAS